MIYHKSIQLKDGRTCILRNGAAADGKAVLDAFNLTHEQTDWLLSYPDESSFTVEQEAEFLQAKTDSTDEIEILAEIDGRVVGCAGIGRVGSNDKVKHRAEMGISVDKEFWGLGIGTKMFEELFRTAEDRCGIRQIELDFIEGNARARGLYEKMGFRITGVKPDAIRMKDGSFVNEYMMIKRLSAVRRENI